MRSRFIGILLAVLAAATPCWGQVIGIFFDQNAQTTVADVPQNTAGQFYILSVLGGGVSGGMTGAEFRVSGMPPEWMADLVPNPASNIQIGSPFNGVGVNIVFPACQTTPVVLLYTVNFFATTAVSNLQLTVLRRNPPLNPNFSCPLMTRCGPFFEIVCASGGQAIINPIVSAVPSSWSRIKTLYAGE